MLQTTYAMFISIGSLVMLELPASAKNWMLMNIKKTKFK